MAHKDGPEIFETVHGRPVANRTTINDRFRSEAFIRIHRNVSMFSRTFSIENGPVDGAALK